MKDSWILKIVCALFFLGLLFVKGWAIGFTLRHWIVAIGGAVVLGVLGIPLAMKFDKA